MRLTIQFERHSYKRGPRYFYVCFLFMESNHYNCVRLHHCSQDFTPPCVYFLLQFLPLDPLMLGLAMYLVLARGILVNMT